MHRVYVEWYMMRLQDHALDQVVLNVKDLLPWKLLSK
jgi:hypothetical protein